MIKVAVSRKGFARVEKSLDDVVRQVQRRAMKDALMKAAQPGLKAARQMVPREHGHLKRSLKKKGKTYERSGMAFVIVGPDRNYQADVDGKVVRPVMYASLVEFGHVVRFRRGGQVYGHVAPDPFLRPAFESTKGTAKKIYAREIGGAIERQAKRAKKREARR